MLNYSYYAKKHCIRSTFRTIFYSNTSNNCIQALHFNFNNNSTRFSINAMFVKLLISWNVTKYMEYQGYKPIAG